MQWTVAGTHAPDGLSNDVLGFLRGPRFSAGVNLGKVFLQLFRQFVPALRRQRRALNRPHTHILAFRQLPPKQTFNSGPLGGGKLFGIANHGNNPYLQFDA